MELEVRLQVYEGPLDLLLHLIDKNKINIYDINIVEITSQYLEYVSLMRQHDLEVVSEFMVMAATLLDIKAKMLLPKEVNEDGEEIDPRQELVEQLLEYKMYKYASYELRDKYSYAETTFFRSQKLPDEVKQFEAPVDLEALLDGITLRKLNDVFKDVMKRKEDKIDPIRSRFGQIEREEVSLTEKMDYIIARLKNTQTIRFFSLLDSEQSKMHTIMSFLAVLELMKEGKIVIMQENIFDDIVIQAA